MLHLKHLHVNTKNLIKFHSSVCFSKGIAFGRRSNRLDLYHPPNVGETGDVIAPLVVFIYGGAWGSGERSMYCLLAKQMAEELNATVICPDYCIYPKVLDLKPHTFGFISFMVHMSSKYKPIILWTKLQDYDKEEI